jgi:hypothetical protein
LLRPTDQFGIQTTIGGGRVRVVHLVSFGQAIEKLLVNRPN